MQKRTFGKEALSNIFPVCFTLRKVGETIAVLLSLRAKGKDFFAAFLFILSMVYRRPLKFEDWRCDSLPSNVKKATEV